MQKIDLDEVAKKYNSRQTIWHDTDKWHIYNYNQIQNFIEQVEYDHLASEKKILNAGSAGQNYGLPEDKMYHIDLVGTNIAEKKYWAVGNIEKLPYDEMFFDLAICVGEVINYTDAAKAISEFSRVLKNGGEIILEYESSNTLELLLKPEFNASSVIVDTFFQGQSEKIWYFSDKYVERLLTEYGFEIINVHRFHILSILVYRLTQSSNFSVKFACLDKFSRYLPGVRNCASNVILRAKKTK